MSTAHRLVIRTDASSAIGTGHVMRMIALGQAWQRRGGRALLATHLCPPALVQRIEKAGLTHQHLPCENPGDARDAAALVRCDADWLVLDGYHFQPDYQRACREAGFRVLCLDDFGHCPHWECDLVLNQNLGAVPPAQLGLNSLTGTSFALLRQEFLDHPRLLRPWGPVTKLLVTLGGSDPRNDTAHLLRLLDQVQPKAMEVRVIIGPSNPHAADLKSLKLSFEVDWREAVTDMPSHYRWANGIISAGGSSCWEWLYFGLPGIVVTIADNQEATVAELSRQKIAHCPGWPARWSDPSALEEWLADPAKSIDREKAVALIDGRGGDRVAATLDGSSCLIREAHPVQDESFTCELANDPTVRAAGYANDPISPAEHRDWLDRHHRSLDSRLFIIETPAQKALGFLRFHRRESGWEIGISLTPEARGKGIAAQAARLGIHELSVRHHLDCFSTPFDETAVDFLEPFDPPFHKVASFELTHHPLLKKIATTGRRVILSTGMATLAEIEEALAVLKTGGCPEVTLLKCTSSYPAPPDEANLARIPEMAARFGVPTGLSDHTMGATVPIAAVALGATVIEKHFCRSRAKPGPDSAFSMEPDEFQAMAEAVRLAEQAVGQATYERTAVEEKSLTFRRSLFVSRDLAAGEAFTPDKLCVIRPAHGLEPKYYEDVLTRTAKVPLKRGTPLAWEHLQ